MKQAAVGDPTIDISFDFVRIEAKPTPLLGAVRRYGER
jgi:hypothetical protein